MTCLYGKYKFAFNQTDGSSENLGAMNIVSEHIQTGTGGGEQNRIATLCQQKTYLYCFIHCCYPVYRDIAGLDGLCHFIRISSQQHNAAYMPADRLFQRRKILSFTITARNQNDIFAETAECSYC